MSISQEPNDASSPPNLSETRAAVWVPILLSVVISIGSLIGWLSERHDQSERQINDLKAAEAKEEAARVSENQRLIDDYLLKVQTILGKNKVISAELRAEYLEPGWGILESYVIKARRDGHDKHVLMYKRISRLVQQNSEILSLLDSYIPHAITPEFKKQTEEFTDHAQRYIDRWEAVPTVVETKQQLPVAKVFPSKFSVALQNEINARKKQSAVTM